MNNAVYRPILMEATGKRINEFRRARKITNEELSETLGVSPQALSKWYSGKCLPEMSNLMFLCDIFGVRVEDLIVRDDDQVVLFLWEI